MWQPIFVARFCVSNLSNKLVYLLLVGVFDDVTYRKVFCVLVFLFFGRNVLLGYVVAIPICDFLPDCQIIAVFIPGLCLQSSSGTEVDLHHL
jgi:hypothetical protein